MGDHLRQGGPSMAAIDGPAGPPMATKSVCRGWSGLVSRSQTHYARLGPAGPRPVMLWRGTTSGVKSLKRVGRPQY